MMKGSRTRAGSWEPWRTPVILVVRLGVVLLGMAGALATAAQTPRVALLGIDTSGWNDLLMVRLSESKAVSLIERELLDETLDEAVLKGALTDRTSRNRIGEIAKADFLAMLSVNGNQARVVVCDTTFGVTLQDLSIGIAEQPRELVLATLADTVLQTVESFAGGIHQVVAVPDFVCRDLTFEHRHLQQDYPAAIRAAYRQIPGMAIVAVEEAKAIAAEQDLVPEKRGLRAVSLFIEGEYRTTRDPKSNRYLVDITLRARDSSKILLERSLPTTVLSQAGAGLMAFFRNDLVKLTTLTGARIDEEAQYKLLIARADAFSTLGEFQRSADLREAALLLKPDADEQRIRLVREYTRHNRNPYEKHAWPEGSKFDDSNPRWVAAFNGSVAGWKRSLQHCEHLVLNRRLSREEATDLTHNAIRSITGVRIMSSNRLHDCEELKKDFVRHVFSRIASLDPATREVRNGLTGALDVYHFIFEAALFRCDGNFHNAENLELIADLLVNRLPDSMWPSYNLNSFLRTAAIRAAREREQTDGFTGQEYLAFLKQLIASDRPLVRVYGRYGNLCLRRQTGEKSDALLEEAQGIMAEAKAVGFDLREYDYFMNQLQSEARDLNYELKKKVAQPVPKAPPIKSSPPPTPKSRVALSPIPLRFTHSAPEDKPISSGMRWNSRGGWSGITHFRPLAAGLDAFWCRGAVFFMTRPGELLQVLADEKLSVADVVCDGRHVWVASFYDWGLSVLDKNGRELARIGQDDGLPPRGHYGLVVHPIEPGRVLVAGSFGNENRGWIAVVEFDGTTKKVDVIHEATKVWDYKDREDRYSQDPAKTFSPEAVVEHIIPGSEPRRILFILRRRGQPLMVDPVSLKVSVYPGTPANKQYFPRHDPPANAFLSIDGTFWVAGSMDDFCSFRINQETGLFDSVRERDRWHAGNGTTGSLCRDGDWLHYVGYKWRRIHLKTGREELLVENFRALPHYGKGGAWRVHQSAHYGFVAFHEGEFYRVEVTP